MFIVGNTVIFTVSQFLLQFSNYFLAQELSSLSLMMCKLVNWNWTSICWAKWETFTTKPLLLVRGHYHFWSSQHLITSRNSENRCLILGQTLNHSQIKSFLNGITTLKRDGTSSVLMRKLATSVWVRWLALDQTHISLSHAKYQISVGE